MVTMQWWNDLWLNEGFASFVEYIGANRVNPEWHMVSPLAYFGKFFSLLWRESELDIYCIGY